MEKKQSYSSSHTEQAVQGHAGHFLVVFPRFLCRPYTFQQAIQICFWVILWTIQLAGLQGCRGHLVSFDLRNEKLI
jgi:hypothetical protein